MSHFTVVTIGKPDDVLAPFNEQDEEYFEPVDHTEEYKKDYEKYHESYDKWLDHLKESGEEDNIVNFMKWWTSVGLVIQEDDKEAIEEAFSKKDQSVMIVNDKGEMLHYYYFHNPNAKWDWWVEGGRFNTTDGRFIFKDGHAADSGRLADVDLDAMIERARKKQAEDYDNVIKKFKRRPKVELSWKKDVWPAIDNVNKMVNDPSDEQREKMKYIADTLRSLYNAQPDVKKWHKVFPHDIFCSMEDYCCSREEFIDKFELPLWAICDENGWHEPTEMGWWAMHDDYDPKAWREKSIEIIRANIKRANENPDYADTMIWTIDCHI